MCSPGSFARKHRHGQGRNPLFPAYETQPLGGRCLDIHLRGQDGEVCRNICALRRRSIATRTLLHACTGIIGFATSCY